MPSQGDSPLGMAGPTSAPHQTCGASPQEGMLCSVDWESHSFLDEFKAIVERHERASTDSQEDVSKLFRREARSWLDDLTEDLPIVLAERRANFSEFEIRLRAHWQPALDLFELLISYCHDIGKRVNGSYRPDAIARQDHRFEALIRLHARAVLTDSEVLALISTGHSIGAMTRWRTLHEVDILSSFLRSADDETARRYLRYVDVQSLKIRRAYDQHHEALGYDPPDPVSDGDPDQLKDDLIAEFGGDFLEKNGWAAERFGRPPSDSDLEQAVGLAHYRPYYYLASNLIHASPKGLQDTIQHLGEQRVLMAGPSNVGLTDPAHASALSLMRCTLSLVNYCADALEQHDDDPSLQFTMAPWLLLDLCDRIGRAFVEIDRRIELEELAPTHEPRSDSEG